MRKHCLRQIKTALTAWASLAVLSSAAFAQTSAPPPAAADLAATINAMVQEPAVSRTHWGVMVTALDGQRIFALNEGQLFQPASNTKLFTTAAALALLKSSTFQTRLIAKGRYTESSTLEGNLVVVGGGDANLSGRPIPYAAPSAQQSKSLPPLRHLEEMADAVATSGLKRIEGDIVGDDTLFPLEPYPIDWAIDDAVWGYGAPVSALTVNDNQIKLTLRPGLSVGDLGKATLDPAISYYEIDASGLTTCASKASSRVEVKRAIGSKILRIYGSIALGGPLDVEEIAIEDPTEYAAMALKSMLESRGLTVTGAARAHHRMSTDAAAFLSETKASADNIGDPITSFRMRGESNASIVPCKNCEDKLPSLPDDLAERTLATHESPSVAEDVVVTNKESQNLHAELLLRQLGAALGNEGTTVQGARVVRSFLLNAGINKDDFAFYDGSGMSGHDLVTPRAIAKLLQFAATQPWFATYKASLPIGGVDGSLESRFTKAPLKGRVFAKTGTNSETRALSGYLECASGRTVIFSILVGDHFPGTPADRDVIDRIVAAIAATN